MSDPKEAFYKAIYQEGDKFNDFLKENSNFVKFSCGLGDGVCLSKVDKTQNPKMIELDPNDWVFAEADLLTSVGKEIDGHTLDIDYLPYVNKKSEVISHEDLLKYYHTHLGAFVFVNHDQGFAQQKGVIVDIVLREILLDENDKEGKKLYYSRGLLAISKKDDPMLAKAVEEGKVKFGSMGNYYSSTTCSFCGKVGLNSSKSDSRCIHLKMLKGTDYKTADGRENRIVEWWNSFDEEGNEEPIVFFEYSLLVCKNGKVGGVCSGLSPAFNGAVIDSGENISLKKIDKPLRIEIPEIYLKKLAFQKYIKNKTIKIVR